MGTYISGLAGEILGNRCSGELLGQQASEEDNRATGPIARHDVLGLPGSVEGGEEDAADRFAADLSDVVLEETVLAAGAGELVRLAVIQRADGDHDGPHGRATLHDAVQHRAL